MITVPVFDTDALLAWGDYPIPAERDEWPKYLNQCRTDCVAAADHILLLEAALAEARSSS